MNLKLFNNTIYKVIIDKVIQVLYGSRLLYTWDFAKLLHFIILSQTETFQ